MNCFWRSSFSVPRLLYYTCQSSSPSLIVRRHLSNDSVEELRNVWVSGLIDPSKTSLEERASIYLGCNHLANNYRESKEVRNLVISSLPMENTTIQSAITYRGNQITLLDTSHSLVDFTFDVQTAMRAFDAAILVLSCLQGVQNQSILIDQQMTRFKFPRLIYINDLDQERVDPFVIVNEVKSKLHHCCAAIQLPLGMGNNCFNYLVDLVNLEYHKFHYSKNILDEAEVAKYMKTVVLEKRRELIETVSEVDDELAEAFHSGNDISASDLDAAIYRATIERKFVPIFMGSATQSMGLRLLMQGVFRYLPSPDKVSNYALDQTKNGEKVELSASIDGPFVALAFTMEHRRLCKLTYLRIYQGVIRKGDFITNVNTGKKIKVPRMFKRRYAELIEDVNVAHAGQIVALFDVDCAPGDTLTDGSVRWAMTSVNGFQRNDPT